MIIFNRSKFWENDVYIHEGFQRVPLKTLAPNKWFNGGEGTNPGRNESLMII